MGIVLVQRNYILGEQMPVRRIRFLLHEGKLANSSFFFLGGFFFARYWSRGSMSQFLDLMAFSLLCGCRIARPLLQQTMGESRHHGKHRRNKAFRLSV